MIFLLLIIRSYANLSFLSIGDWGGQDKEPHYTTPQMKSATLGMPLISDKINAEFVLALGDNFYGSGIHGDEHDPRFKETFEDVYSSPSLQIPFYACAGNHDHMHNVTAQIFYSNHSSRWTFPDLYYTFTKSFNTSAGERTAQFILLDTVVFSGLSYHDEELDLFVKPKGPQDIDAANSQQTWLETTLAQSKADYIWVGGHYPVWSVCSHGPTKKLIENVKPLLEKYDVTGYISGHDHCQSFVQEHSDGPAYPLAGNTHGCCYGPGNLSKNPPGSVKWYIAADNAKGQQSGFASFTMDATIATIRMHDENGKTLFQSTRKARKVLRKSQKLE